MIIPKIIISSRQREIMFYGEVVLIQHVEIEEWRGKVLLRVREQAGSTNGQREIGSNRQAVSKGGNEDIQCQIPAITWEYAVIGQ